MRFLVDANLPIALAQWLRQHKHDAEHVAETGSPAGSDEQRLTRAAELMTIGRDG
jgi:predicted nuclease of predicted toxin-antitoxin system